MLRCYDDASGTLSIAQDNDPDIEERFDIKDACTGGSVIFKSYDSQWPVRFTFEQSNGEVAEVISKYGSDVQVGNHHGYYLVLQIMNNPPFIANDRI